MWSDVVKLYMLRVGRGICIWRNGSLGVVCGIDCGVGLMYCWASCLDAGELPEYAQVEVMRKEKNGDDQGRDVHDQNSTLKPKRSRANKQTSQQPSTPTRIH